ncbi:MAG: membrane-bound lytic murein transglycosylase B [Paracoccaceae bacterium]|jgi:membrane-bound lytic murein transglycosylase B
MHVWTNVGSIGAMLATALSVGAVETSIRPEARPDVVVLASETIPSEKKTESFQDWIAGFRQRAQSVGISEQVMDQAFQGMRYDANIIKRDRNQSEFTKTIWDYLDSAVSDLRVSNGKDALRKNQNTLDAIEAKYGVEKDVVVAIWGLESAYGTFRGSSNIVQSLATLAYDGRRGEFFEAQLVAALSILQDGDTTPDNMTGSWAGAMGHTQFIPTSYLAYAVDFTGDGRRDIWSDDPTDALASTAAYLAQYGWVRGQPWGVEVTLPKGFNYTLANRNISKAPKDWAELGIVGVDGLAVPNHGDGSILLPAGWQGAAFMIFHNFEVIEKYNTADAYVIGVGHLSDRISGGKPFKSNWPRADRALTLSERLELQQLLTAKGFSTLGVDGKIGPKTIAAVRGYQLSLDMVADGYPSLVLLNKLRG